MRHLKVSEFDYLFVWSFFFLALYSSTIVYNIHIATIKHGFRDHIQKHSCGERLNSYVFFSLHGRKFSSLDVTLDFFFLSFFFYSCTDRRDMLGTSLYGVRIRIYDSTGKKLYTKSCCGEGDLIRLRDAIYQPT